MTNKDNKFERDKLAYQEHSQGFRHLNTQMWQVPIIAMTLTGGLWFGVFSSKINDYFASGLLLFAGICDLLFILVLHRVRFIMSLIIEKLKDFNPEYAIDPINSAKGNKLIKMELLVINVFSFMLLLASAFSFFAAVYKTWPWLFN
ncbi:hypothetical protein [Aliikangiella sp. IMCC44632]